MNSESKLNVYIDYLKNSIADINLIDYKASEMIWNRFKKSNTDINLDEILKNDESNYRAKLFLGLNRYGYKFTKVIEEYEYEKPYKYSVLYKFHLSDRKIEDRIKSNISKNIILKKSEHDHCFRVIQKPTVLVNDGIIDLKFCYLVKSRMDEPVVLKYPILVTIYLELNMLQIKFDGLPDKFKKDNFFVKINNNVKSWIQTFLKITLTEFDSFSAVKSIIEKKEITPEEYEEVTEFIKDSEDNLNGRTMLRANNNDKLPIVGRLKQLVEALESEKDKQTLQKFIKDLEVGTKYYVRGLRWRRKISENRTTTQVVTFRKNYANAGFTLIHFHDNNQTREKMNYVVQYLEKYS